MFVESLEKPVKDGGKGLLFVGVFLFEKLSRLEYINDVGFNTGKGRCVEVCWVW